MTDKEWLQREQELRDKIVNVLLYNMQMPGEAAVRAAIHLDTMRQRDGFILPRIS